MRHEGLVNQISDIPTLLRPWLATQADTGLAWLDEAAARVTAEAADRTLYTAFTAAPRHVGRDELPACEIHGHRLAGWTRDQVARVLLLLSLGTEEPQFLRVLDRLFSTADLAELVTLYQTLPLLPFAEQHLARAAEGVRSNMLPVFQAVAIGNSYPAARLDEGAWNQMVVKAVFVGCKLHGIVGLDRRANPALARMLVDYARERRAAERDVAPDLWRPVGPFAVDDRALHELRHALASEDEERQAAAGLALAASPYPGARAVLATRPSLASDIEAGRVSWHTLSQGAEAA